MLNFRYFNASVDEVLLNKDVTQPQVSISNCFALETVLYFYNYFANNCGESSKISGRFFSPKVTFDNGRLFCTPSFSSSLVVIWRRHQFKRRKEERFQDNQCDKKVWSKFCQSFHKILPNYLMRYWHVTIKSRQKLPKILPNT